MRRRPMNARHHAKNFTKTRKRSKLINSPTMAYRGGIRF